MANIVSHSNQTNSESCLQIPSSWQILLLIPTKLIRNLALKFRSAGNIWPPLEALNDELEDLVLLNDDLLLAVNKSNINEVKLINSKPAIVPTPIPEQKMIQERTQLNPIIHNLPDDWRSCFLSRDFAHILQVHLSKLAIHPKGRRNSFSIPALASSSP